MPLLAAKQLSKFLAAYVALTNQSVSSANSLNITSALTTALSTASNSGGSVPLNPSGSNSIEGVITGSAVIVPVFAYPSGSGIEIAGNQVYGVLTYATSVYTVSFYTLVAGVQTAAILNQAVNLLIPYSFSFNDLPYNALMAVINNDPGSPGAGGGTFYVDTSISVTGTNAISNLAKLPINPASVILSVNGQELAAGTSFSVSGQAITISSGQITANGYNITTTDSVYAIYAY